MSVISSKNRSLFQVKDRKLGDEWLDWEGAIDQPEVLTASGKRIYMGVLLFAILLGGLILFTFWYLISPRLSQFHAHLPLIIGILFLLFWSILALWFSIMVLSILLEKDFLMRLGGREFSITFLVPVVFKLGQRIGISRDRLGNSFVKLSNTFIKFKTAKVDPERIMVLLPRCLQKPLRDRITSISQALKIPVFTVPGGEMARKLVLENNPKAIIGVACERDLLSGIRDVIKKVPVIGIPNQRPEGPCKNTRIDIKDFESALRIFLRKDIHIAAQ
jgi:hypothetical protein